MKKILSYVITACLIAIVILMLLRNKQEINAQIAYAEKEVEAIPVKTEAVTFGTLDTELEVSGILAPANELMLMAETQGRVLEIFKKEGEKINKGEALAKVDDELMRAELMVTEANFEKAKKDLERALTLSEGGAITQQQLEGLQLQEKAAEAKFITSKKRVADAVIRAPFSGVINRLFLKEGGMIGAGVPACELVNISRLKMSVSVDAEEVIKINTGQQVDIITEMLPNKILKGRVTGIGAKADYALQYTIDIMLDDNPDERLKPGMVATAFFVFHDLTPGAIISETAIVSKGKDPHVFVVTDDKAHLVPIEIDFTEGDRVKISAGLSEGDMLIYSGQFSLRDNMKVNVIE